MEFKVGDVVRILDIHSSTSDSWAGLVAVVVGKGLDYGPQLFLVDDAPRPDGYSSCFFWPKEDLELVEK